MKNYMKSKKALRNGIFLGICFTIFSLLIFSCEKYQFEPPKIDPNVEISFQDVLLPVFEAKCIGCHNGSVPPDLRSEKAYSSLTKTNRYISADPENNPEESLIYSKLEEGHVASISEIEKLQILYWVKQGAKNN